MEITQDEWNEYNAIRESGITNMFDTKKVCELSDGILTREKCLEIMKSYSALMLKYGF